MTERQLQNKFIKQFNDFGRGVLYNIGDTFGGQKKPFDCFGCIDSKFIAIEFKKENGKLKEHQKIALLDIYNNEGISLVGRFYNNKVFFEFYILSQYFDIEYNKGSFDIRAFVGFLECYINL